MEDSQRMVSDTRSICFDRVEHFRRARVVQIQQDMEIDHFIPRFVHFVILSSCLPIQVYAFSLTAHVRVRELSQPKEATLLSGRALLNSIGQVLCPMQQVTELAAVAKALDTANKVDPSKTKPLHVYTDSQRVSTSPDKAGSRPVTVSHVSAHSGQSDWASSHNAQAHTSARHAAMSKH